LKAAQRSLRGDFDFKYYRCIDERGAAAQAAHRLDPHWCKVVALNHIARETAYRRVIMLDTDVSMNEVRRGALGTLFNVIATQRFMVPDAASRTFRKASLANASIITDIAHSCGQSTLAIESTPNMHCTAVVLARMDPAGKATLQAWLEAYSPTIQHVGPFFDQLGFNMLLRAHGPRMGVLASDVVRDITAKDYTNRVGSGAAACRGDIEYNSRVVQDAMAAPSTSSIELFHHDRSKSCVSARSINLDLGDDLSPIMRGTPDMVVEIEFGAILQEQLTRHRPSTMRS